MDTQPKKIPNDLLKQLHEADRQLHESGEQLKQTQDEADYSHQEHLNRSTNQYREAEAEVEKINGKIKEAIIPPTPPIPPKS